MQPDTPIPPGWERHGPDASGDVWYTSSEGASLWQIPAGVWLEHLRLYYLGPAPEATESSASPDAVAHLVACALHTPLVLACLRALRSSSDEEVAASPHLAVARAAWRAVEGARRRSLAAAARLAAEAEARAVFACPVCLEQGPAAARVALPACGDALCRGCLQASLGVQLRAHPRSTARLACPYGAACAAAAHGAPAPLLLGDFAEEALAAEVRQGSAALQRQWALARNPALVPCPAPRCEAGYARRPTRAQAWVAQCLFCDARFCGLHGLRHAVPAPDAGGEAALAACSAHAALEAEPPAPLALVGTMPCPGCLMPTYRDTGCDHMRCTLCDTQWCWACGGVRLGSGHACAAWRALADDGVQVAAADHILLVVPPRPPGPPPGMVGPILALHPVAAAAPRPPQVAAATSAVTPCLVLCRGLIEGARSLGEGALSCLPRRLRFLRWHALPAVVLSPPLLALQLAIYAVLLLLHAPRILLNALSWGLKCCLQALCACLQPHWPRHETPSEAVAASHARARGVSLKALEAIAGLLATLMSLGFSSLRSRLISYMTACLWLNPEPFSRRVAMQRILTPWQVPEADWEDAEAGWDYVVRRERSPYISRDTRHLSIGVFTSESSERPGCAWLSRGLPALTGAAAVSAAAVARVAGAAGGRPTSPACCVTAPPGKLVGSAARQALVWAVEEAWQRAVRASEAGVGVGVQLAVGDVGGQALAAVHAAAAPGAAALARSVVQGSTLTDFKLLLTLQQLEGALGSAACAALCAALQRWSPGAGAAAGAAAPLLPDAIALRRTTANGRWIDFHTDAAARTLGVPLQEEGACTGGALVFATAEGRLLVPRRLPGCAIVHDGNVAHGVTRLTSGVRYALFLLKARGE